MRHRGLGCEAVAAAEEGAWYMKSDVEAAIEVHKRELIQSAATLFAAQRVYGANVREQTMKAYGRLVDAHLLATGVLGAGLLRINGKIIPIAQTCEERNGLFASFVIGMDACENAIVEGRYLQALALLRQEMETVAQLKVVRAGTRKENCAPNVGVLEKSMARMYGELSAAAHLSRPHIVRAATEYNLDGADLPGPTSGTRYFPAFDERVARGSFSLHLMLTLCVIEELSIDLPEDAEFTKREAEAVNLAVVLMEAEGMANTPQTDC